MDRVGLSQAIEAFDAAGASRKFMEASNSHTDTVRYWVSFLHEMQRCINKLGKSAAGRPSSSKWFRDLLAKQKGSTVMAFIHHARNTDQHGIAELSTLEEIGFMKMTPLLTNQFGTPKPVAFNLKSSYAVPVIDRGVTYLPPVGVPGDSVEEARKDPRLITNVAKSSHRILRQWIEEAVNLSDAV